jgi:hypothetical protein
MGTEDLARGQGNGGASRIGYKPQMNEDSLEIWCWVVGAVFSYFARHTVALVFGKIPFPLPQNCATLPLTAPDCAKLQTFIKDLVDAMRGRRR